MTTSDLSRVVMTMAITQLICDLIANWRIFKTEQYERLVNAYGRSKFKRDKAWKDAIEGGVDIKVLENQDDKDGITTTTKTTTTTQKNSTMRGGKTGNKKSGGGGGGNRDNKLTRLTKAYHRADQDCIDSGALVARKHMLPNMLSSLVFLILMRILGTEYKGQIIGLLPFVPWSWVQRTLTGRGLEFRTDLAFTSSDPEKVSTIEQAISFVLIYMLCTLSVKFYVNKLVGTRPPNGADGMLNLTNSSWGKYALKQAGLDARDFKLE